ncbi:MAG: hypothetical protein ISS70_03325 [Phycisphaerae bacterium]|nr:hypothetical protein [Phycisphaerae bacterium]
MALAGKQKAALLVMNLGIADCQQLLKDTDSETIQELALELAYMDTEQLSDVEEDSQAVTQEFCKDLEAGKGFHLRTFIKDFLENTVGTEKAEYFQEQIKKATKERDPFISIRLADVNDLAFVLQSQPANIAAIVLLELAPRKSRAILELLGKELQVEIVCKMTQLTELSSNIRQKVAEIITEAVKKIEEDILPEKEETILRKLALVIGSMRTERRDQILNAINSGNSSMYTKIRNLMITWEDIPSIVGKAMEGVLRTIDTTELAVALHKAEEAVKLKVRSSISERAAERLDEEISLMEPPTDEEVFEAREKIMEPLRELSSKGGLQFAGR